MLILEYPTKIWFLGGWETLDRYLLSPNHYAQEFVRLLHGEFPVFVTGTPKKIGRLPPRPYRIYFFAHTSSQAPLF
jgi:hypothetical protein